MDELITFGDDDLIWATEEAKMEVKEEAWLDMWLDLTWTTEEAKMEVKEEAWLDMWLDLTWTTEEAKMEVKEEAWLDMWLDLTWAPEEVKTEVKEEAWLDIANNEVVNEKNTSVFSLEEATATYVRQLEARKEQISNDISDDEKIIWIKEDKIKNLRSEISDYKKLIKELNDENAEIDNKINLVTWKNTVKEIKKTTTTRVHNAKRKKA
jgi:predicted RNase H-like nuclease (RuvC/YqgF family)